jgi:4'-phosphopantetheinyl transferase
MKILEMLSSSFNPPPLDLELTDDEIHIWCAVLDSPPYRIRRFVQLLSIDERTRAQLFHFERDRKRFIVGRGMLRMILGFYLNFEPSQLKFCYGKNGKPALADTFGKGRICFNLSKSDGVALFAFTGDREIGVDIEKIRDIPEMEQIAENFFSVRENEVFRALPRSEKQEAFFSCWTRKEALVKAIGDGLSCPLDTFDVSLVPGDPAMLLRIEGDSEAASRWSIQELEPAFGFAAAFAVTGRRWRLHCWQWLS